MAMKLVIPHVMGKTQGQVDGDLPAAPTSPDAEAPAHQKVMSVTDLIIACNEAASKMSASNEHRLLIMNCGYAIRQLVDRLDFHERQGRTQ